MTIQDEEKFIADQIETAQMAVREAEKAKRLASDNLQTMRDHLETVKQAAIDYCLGNGLKSCDSFSISSTYSVDVEDIDAVPEEFIRTKITKEANKVLIREAKPQGNWYVMKEGYKLHIK